MNPVVIFLGIVVVLLLWYLYTYYLSATSLSTGQVNLNSGSTTIPVTNLANPASTNFSYGVWVYVNSWNTNAAKPIMSRGTNQFKLSLGQATPTLTCAIPNSTNDSIAITNAFPIQKWVYVIVSVDGMTADAYLDGKLVISKQLNQPVTSDATSPIILGGSPNPDIYLTKINWWPTPMNPQLAWNYYLQGNGLSSSSQYNVRLEVLHDNVQQKQFTLF
jgi:hypothetical protein